MFDHWPGVSFRTGAAFILEITDFARIRFERIWRAIISRKKKRKFTFVTFELRMIFILNCGSDLVSGTFFCTKSCIIMRSFREAARIIFLSGLLPLPNQNFDLLGFLKAHLLLPGRLFADSEWRIRRRSSGALSNPSSEENHAARSRCWSSPGSPSLESRKSRTEVADSEILKKNS